MKGTAELNSQAGHDIEPLDTVNVELDPKLRREVFDVSFHVSKQ